jgi:hypothetical protein
MRDTTNCLKLAGTPGEVKSNHGAAARPRHPAVRSGIGTSRPVLADS